MYNLSLSFIKDFLVIFIVFGLLYGLFVKFFYKDINDYEGFYKIDTSLPSFSGNSIILTLYDQKCYKIFLGRTKSEVLIKKNEFYFNGTIYLKYITNVDFWFYNWHIYKDLKNLTKNDNLQISFNNKGCIVFYGQQKFNPQFTYDFKVFKISKHQFLRLVFNLSFNKDNKGINLINEKIYIKEMSLLLNLIKVE